MSDAENELRLHALCMLIRGKPCEGCPAWFESPEGAPARRGCRIQAEEAANIALHGNPWGEKATPEVIEQWRRRQRNRMAAADPLPASPAKG